MHIQYNQIIPDKRPTYIGIWRAILFCLFHTRLYFICTIHRVPPTRKLIEFILPIFIFFYLLYCLSSGVNKTVPCSVSVPIFNALVLFTIVPDFNVQASPIRQYGSTTMLAPTTVA